MAYLHDLTRHSSLGFKNFNHANYRLKNGVVLPDWSKASPIVVLTHVAKCLPRACSWSDAKFHGGISRFGLKKDLASYRVASIAFNACSVPCDFSSGRSQFVDKTLKGHAGIICKFWCQKQSSAIVLLFYTMSIEKEARYNAVPEDTEMSILVEQL